MVENTYSPLRCFLIVDIRLIKGEDEESVCVRGGGGGGGQGLLVCVIVPDMV